MNSIKKLVVQSAKFLMMAAFAVTLAACNSLNHKIAKFSSKQDPTYLSAKATPRLRLPQGLSSKHIASRYTIPKLVKQSHGVSPDITPTGLATETAKFKTSREDKGDDRPHGLLRDLFASHSSVQLKPATKQSARKAGLTKDALGSPVLLLNTTYDQAWERAKGVLIYSGYTRIRPGSLISSYFFTAKLHGMREPRDFQLHLETIDSQVAITVLDLDKHSTKTKASHSILTRLSKQWSTP